jgi:hypothetical protein
VRLERRPEARLALELRARGCELLAGILELAGEDPGLADGFASLVRPGGLGGQQAEQDDVVVDEQRFDVGVDRQPALRASSDSIGTTIGAGSQRSAPSASAGGVKL